MITAALSSDGYPVRPEGQGPRLAAWKLPHQPPEPRGCGPVQEPLEPPRKVGRRALARCGWLIIACACASTALSVLPHRGAPCRHLVAEHAPVIAAHPELDACCSG